MVEKPAADSSGSSEKMMAGSTDPYKGLLLFGALAVRELGVLMRGLRKLVSFRGVLVALHVVIFAVLFGRGAMGLRCTLMVLCRPGMCHLHFDSSCWAANADQRMSGADRVAGKCKWCSH
jgi:hypothetical protein